MNLRWLTAFGVGVTVAALLGASPGVLAAGRPETPGNGIRAGDPTAGVIQTLAGGSAAGGQALDSTFFQPYGAAVGPDGTLYVADSYDNQIKAINRNGRVVVVGGTGDAGLAGDGGPARVASFNFPLAVQVGPDNAVYVADTWNDRVRRIDPGTGVVTTVAGTGPNDSTGRQCTPAGGSARNAVISQPHDITLTGAGDLLVADTGCDVIERVSPRTGAITVIAGVEGHSATSGDGPATNAPLANPLSVSADPLGNAVVLDTSNHLYYVNVQDHPVTLFPRAARPLTVGPGDKATVAALGGNPWTTGFADDGSLLISGRTQVTRLDWTSGAISPVAGNGSEGEGSEQTPANDTPLSYPSAVFGDHVGGFIVVDRGNSRLRRVDAGHGNAETTIAGRPNLLGAALGDGGPANQAELNEPDAVAVGSSGVYIADPYNRRIRRVNPDGTIVTVVSTGPPCVRQGAGVADCAGPTVDRGTGMSASRGGLLAFVRASRIFVLNDGNHAASAFGQVVRPGDVIAVTPPGALLGAAGLAFGPTGDLVIAEQRANRIDRVDHRTGAVSAVAGAGYLASDPVTWLDGPGALARFSQPTGVAVANNGTIYVADAGNNRVRRIDAHRHTVSTVAGIAVAGFAGDGGPAVLAELAYPTDVAVSNDGSLFVVDWGNERVRRIDRSGVIRTYAGGGPGRVGRACGSTIPCGHFQGDSGPAPGARLYFPLDVASYEAAGPDGRLYVADAMNNRVRVISPRA